MAKRFVFVDKMPVAKCLLHAPLELLALEGTPLAFALDHILAHRPRSMRPHDSDVGLIAWSQETPVAHLEDAGRIVRRRKTGMKLPVFFEKGLYFYVLMC